LRQYNFESFEPITSLSEVTAGEDQIGAWVEYGESQQVVLVLVDKQYIFPSSELKYTLSSNTAGEEMI
jgi:hypothetical protein